jgi:hypothetical protein
MTKPSLVELVESAAEARNNPPVERKYIEEALKRIVDGRETVQRYPMGAPSLLGVYSIALQLESDDADIH